MFVGEEEKRDKAISDLTFLEGYLVTQNWEAALHKSKEFCESCLRYLLSKRGHNDVYATGLYDLYIKCNTICAFSNPRLMQCIVRFESTKMEGNAAAFAQDILEFSHVTRGLLNWLRDM